PQGGVDDVEHFVAAGQFCHVLHLLVDIWPPASAGGKDCCCRCNLARQAKLLYRNGPICQGFWPKLFRIASEFFPSGPPCLFFSPICGMIGPSFAHQETIM